MAHHALVYGVSGQAVLSSAINDRGTRFAGPVFIVGMPRSGTKLVRDLLNQNPRIAIPVSESHFIPSLIAKHGRAPGFTDPAKVARFYEDFSATNFYSNMKNRGVVLPEVDFARCASHDTWPHALARIFRFYAGTTGPRGDFREDTVWGDKTPWYLEHITLLKDVFPAARFIHVIRDPRDAALSMRKAWGISKRRSAAKWTKGVAAAIAQGAALGDAYQQVFYEQLLEEPETVLRRLCDHLDCEFTPEMMMLGRDTENLGAARGRRTIVASNSRKYLRELSPPAQRRLLEIALPVAVELGYDVAPGMRHRPLSRVSEKALGLYDALASLRFHVREKGPAAGFRYYWRLFASRR